MKHRLREERKVKMKSEVLSAWLSLFRRVEKAFLGLHSVGSLQHFLESNELVCSECVSPFALFSP